MPQTHFLRLLNELIDWDFFTVRLIELYRGGDEYGRLPFNQGNQLKMGLLNGSSGRTEKIYWMHICLVH